MKQPCGGRLGGNKGQKEGNQNVLLPQGGGWVEIVLVIELEYSIRYVKVKSSKHRIKSLKLNLNA